MKKLIQKKTLWRITALIVLLAATVGVITTQNNRSSNDLSCNWRKNNSEDIFNSITLLDKFIAISSRDSIILLDKDNGDSVRSFKQLRYKLIDILHTSEERYEYLTIDSCNSKLGLISDVGEKIVFEDFYGANIEDVFVTDSRDIAIVATSSNSLEVISMKDNSQILVLPYFSNTPVQVSPNDKYVVHVQNGKILATELSNNEVTELLLEEDYMSYGNPYQLGITSDLDTIAISTDGYRATSNLFLWKANGHEPIDIVELEFAPESLKFSQNGELLLINVVDEMYLYDLGRKKIISLGVGEYGVFSDNQIVTVYPYYSFSSIEPQINVFTLMGDKLYRVTSNDKEIKK